MACDEASVLSINSVSYIFKISSPKRVDVSLQNAWILKTCFLWQSNSTYIYVGLWLLLHVCFSASLFCRVVFSIKWYNLLEACLFYPVPLFWVLHLHHRTTLYSLYFILDLDEPVVNFQMMEPFILMKNLLVEMSNGVLLPQLLQLLEGLLHLLL